MIFYTDGLWTVERRDWTENIYRIYYRGEPVPGVNRFSCVVEAINSVPLKKSFVPRTVQLLHKATMGDGLIRSTTYWYNVFKRDGFYGLPKRTEE